jgi:hypothetical protein
MSYRQNTRIGSIIVVAMATVLAGCGSEEPVATTAAANDAVTASVPTFSEIQAAVSLDDEDAALVKSALGEWREAAAEDVSDAEPFARPRPAMDFVAAVAPSFDNAQLEDLVAFLVAYRESHMRGQRSDGQGDRDRDRLRIHDRLKELLGLSANQTAAMQALHQETRARARELHQAFRQGSITEEQMDERMQALHAAQREKLAEILTADQLAKFDALREEHRARRIERRAERVELRTERHAQWLGVVLGLSDAQKAQVQTALSSLADKQTALLESARGGDVERAEVRLQMRAEREACSKALDDILTDEQSARWRIVRQLHPRGPRDL